MKPITLLLLITTNMIWAMNPLMGKWVLADFQPLQVAWIRYFSAAIFFWMTLLICRFSVRFRNWMGPLFPFFKTRKTAFQVIAMGLITFCLGPLLAFIGLSRTQAIDNALVVALEPLVTVLLAFMILREPLRKVDAIGFAIALFGFALLSGIVLKTHEATSSQSSVLGNIVIALSLLGEGFFSVFSRILIRKFNAVAIFATSLAIGALALTIVMFMTEGLPSLQSFTLQSALAALWIGPLGTGVCYFIWLWLLRHATVSSIAASVLIQPVVGALGGYFFLHEILSSLQALGAFLIILAVFTPLFVQMFSDTLRARVRERAAQKSQI